MIQVLELKIAGWQLPGNKSKGIPVLISMNQKSVKRLASFYIKSNSSRASIYLTSYLSITEREAISTTNLFLFHHSLQDVVCSPYRYHLTLVWKNVHSIRETWRLLKLYFNRLVRWKIVFQVSTYVEGWGQSEQAPTSAPCRMDGVWTGKNKFSFYSWPM